MSMADEIFISMCKDILENGTDTRGEKTSTGLAGGFSCAGIALYS